MHISEGFLTTQALAIGWTAAGIGVAAGLRKTDPDKIIRVAVMSSAFFLASLINVKIGPVSTHLSLIAPLGLLIGWASFPAVLIALLLQAVFFQFGGLLVLGVNTLDMALPALVVYLLFAGTIRRGNRITAAIASFAAGFAAIVMAAALLSLFLSFGDPDMLGTAKVVFVTHIPLALVEGVITLLFTAFLRKAAPDVLRGLDG